MSDPFPWHSWGGGRAVADVDAVVPAEKEVSNTEAYLKQLAAPESVAHVREDIQANVKTVAQMQERLAKLMGAFAEVRSQNAALDEENARLRAIIAQLEAELARRPNGPDDAILRELADYKARCEMLQVEVNQLRDENERLRRQMSERIESLQTQLSTALASQRRVVELEAMLEDTRLRLGESQVKVQQETAHSRMLEEKLAHMPAPAPLPPPMRIETVPKDCVRQEHVQGMIHSELMKQRVAIEGAYTEKYALRLEQERDNWRDELRRERDARSLLQGEHDRLSSHVELLSRRLRDSEAAAAAAQEEANEHRRALVQLRREAEAERALFLRELKSAKREAVCVDDEQNTLEAREIQPRSSRDRDGERRRRETTPRPRHRRRTSSRWRRCCGAPR